ncbi:MAG: hypothetical protein ACLQDQ_04670 [Myxococcaceae bacterium]
MNIGRSKRGVTQFKVVVVDELATDNGAKPGLLRSDRVPATRHSRLELPFAVGRSFGDGSSASFELHLESWFAG